jgi:hypothetical protein
MTHTTKPSIIEPLAIDNDLAAQIINIQPGSLEKDRKNGHLGIPFIKAGRRVIYRLSDLRAWLEENKQIPPSRGGANDQS